MGNTAFCDEIPYMSGIYDGELNAERAPEGRGTLRTSEKEYYVGEWKNGTKDGYGKQFFENGEILEGNWINN